MSGRPVLAVSFASRDRKAVSRRKQVILFVVFLVLVAMWRKIAAPTATVNHSPIAWRTRCAIQSGTDGAGIPGPAVFLSCLSHAARSRSIFAS